MAGERSVYLEQQAGTRDPPDTVSGQERRANRLALGRACRGRAATAFDLNQGLIDTIPMI